MGQSDADLDRDIRAQPRSDHRHPPGRPDRFATAAAISAASFEPNVPVAYIANGLNFPDALAGAAAAGKAGARCCWSARPRSRPRWPAELTRLKPAKIVVLGGTERGQRRGQERARHYTAGTVTRLVGPNLFATAAEISAATFEPGVPVAYIANGLNFPDALAGAAAAGKAGARCCW